MSDLATALDKPGLQIKKSSIETWIKFLRETKLHQTHFMLFNFRNTFAATNKDDLLGCCGVGGGMIAAGVALDHTKKMGVWERLRLWLSTEPYNCGIGADNNIVINKVIDMNDHQDKTFAQIADYLESEILPRCQPQ